MVPTVADLLILGREAALREHPPTHEVAFQVLEGTQARVNDFHRPPLLKTFEREDQASYLLRKLAREGKLALVGRGRGAYYRPF
jgi:hypothetical protein